MRSFTTPSSSLLEGTEEGRAFLQERVAGFGLMAGGGGLAFVAFRVVMVLTHGGVQELASLDMVAHLVAATLMGSMWLLCRRGKRSARFVRLVESLGLVAGSFAYELMALSIPVLLRPDLIVLLALNFGLVARAIYVPSTARRTISLGVVIGVPLVVLVWLAYAYASDDQLAWFRESMASAGITELDMATGVALETAVWWGLSVAVCGATARVIYGLRREVRDVRRLGQYTLESKLGEGGMGVVYRARHAMLRRPTAIKLLPRERAGEHALQRFEREVQLTALLTHPNTVRVFDYGRTPDDIFYYVMELLEGATLEDVVAIDGPQPAGRVAHILGQVAGALAEAHGHELVHRDIKPANIMLLEQGGVPDVTKVLDFGLVKGITQGDDASETQTGAITGTPQFISPEAITQPDKVDARSDIYALGAVGYFLIAGSRPFQGKTVVEVCSQHLHSEPEPPSQRLGVAVPSELEQLLLRCLAKDPDNRPQDAAALQERLRECGLSWSKADAQAWWQKHRSEVAKRRSAMVESASGEALAVDLQWRR